MTSHSAHALCAQTSLKSKFRRIFGQKNRRSLEWLWRLFAFADTFDRIFVVLGATIATITGFSWNLLTVAFGDVVDVFVAFERNARNNASEVESAEFLRNVYFFSYSLLALWILNFVSNFLICLLFSRAANNQIRRIKNRYFASLLRQEVAWHDQNANTAFASTVTTDLKRIEDGMNEKFGLAVYNASTALIAIATAFVYGWKLTLIIISLLPFLAFGTSVMNKVQATFARKEVEAYAAAGGVAEEAIAGIRTVVAFGAQQHESERYERHLLPAMRSGIRRNLMTGLGNGLMFACLYAGLALGIWFGVQMILESRDYTIGTIVIVFWCVSGAGLCSRLRIAVARATAAKVFATIERRPLIDVTSEGGVKPEPIRAEIEFKNVDFWYPSRPEVKVLNGFSLTIKEGESVALVGASGSGKSTVLQLLQRFYDANGGVVSVGGRDVREWNVQYLRQQMGAVGQEPALFDTTIRENVALGSHSKLVDDEDVERALQEANAKEFVAKLPQGWDTRVGDRGAQLSGGQKQRIAIARALINAPKVLLLDEATSALDTRSEAVVQTALEKASKGRTSVVVAHRLSTVVNCDRIVVMETGRVVETGTHAQLLERKGVYHALVRQQSAAAEPEVTDADESEAVESGDQVADEAEVLVGVDLEEEALKKFSQKRLFALFAADKFYIVAGLALSLLYGLIVPIYAFIFGAFVEHKREPHPGERLTLRLRKLAFDAILRQEITWFDRPDNSCGALCARLSADAANVQGASGSRMAIICQALSTFLASAVLGFVLSWQLSLVAMVFIPFILIGSAIGASVDNWTARANKRGVEMAAKVAIETLSSIRTVISLQREQHFSQQFQRIVDENAK
ncbi:unnamed protein product [Medioppia subpectinata]|uniref:Uncharacterized protein n=1 Tax=Medioppia subpectinata TaxID=1979941 RepID=A0A7R9KFS5_9ACAR|nr:unnamed protein product [Medioppia subpectinata]CAG2102555.1 unnamed protein product [Medioppia subpectinata]